jgi:hypothetical protein
MTSPFDGLQVPRELVCEFFAVFSRFEYTLKESHFVKHQYGRATPDWGKYAQSVAGRISADNNAELEQAIRYLIDDPPQVQIVQGGAAVWQPAPLRKGTEIERALEATQRVRNNLFHGGKHTSQSPAGRDKKLLRAALVVLNGCLSADDKFRATYEQAAL